MINDIEKATLERNGNGIFIDDRFFAESSKCCADEPRFSSCARVKEQVFGLESSSAIGEPQLVVGRFSTWCETGGLPRSFEL